MRTRSPLVLVGSLSILLALLFCGASTAQTTPASGPREMSVVVGKSLVVDSPVTIQRVSVANSEVAEAVVISPREILVNAKAPGETSLIIWQEGGARLLFDLTVVASNTRIEAIRRQIREELKNQDVKIELDGDNVFLTGVVSDMISADRAVTISSVLGKPVNLLRVSIPPADSQVLLKVRFANVDRAAGNELGANIFSIGALNTVGGTTTGQFASPRWETGSGTGGGTTLTLTDALNVFLFRPDLNLGATIKALENKRLLEILAEPNVLAMDGRQASFLAGGEFPYPTLQGGAAGVGQITIQYREFGVRITFTPKITPRGTIRLEVTPEVSSLDYANSLVFQGYTIPGLNTRRVQTEIELQDRQSFAIAGLLDSRATENLSKIPGLGDIPLLGKLFQTKSLQRSNSELLVLVTPEVVQPIPVGQKLPDVAMPKAFLEGTATAPPRTPAADQTGKSIGEPPSDPIPVERLIEKPKPSGGTGAEAAGFAAMPYLQVQPVQAPARPAPAPAPAAPKP